MSAPFILASASPRRRRLCEQAGLLPEVVPAAIDESTRLGEPAGAYAARMAADKALAVARDRGGALVLGADTVVHSGDEIFDKPRSAAEACAMLQALAGRWHDVTTAFALCRDLEILERQSVTTRVCFRALSAADVERYVDSGEALDKAGAYGIQGKGGSLVDQVQGSYTNVVGLPLPEVLTCLRRHGVVTP